MTPEYDIIKKIDNIAFKVYQNLRVAFASLENYSNTLFQPNPANLVSNLGANFVGRTI